MENVSRTNNHRRQTEFHIQSIVDATTGIRLRRKYFDKFTKIYFHDVSDCDLSSVQSSMKELLNHPNTSNDVLWLLNNHDVLWLLNNHDSSIVQSTHYTYLSTSVSSYLYDMYSAIIFVKSGLPRVELSSSADLVGLMNVMHVYMDRNVFNNLNWTHVVDDDGAYAANWTREIQQMYETNYNEHNRIIALENATDNDLKDVRSRSLALVSEVIASQLSRMTGQQFVHHFDSVPHGIQFKFGDWTQNFCFMIFWNIIWYRTSWDVIYMCFMNMFWILMEG
eukprot:745457_1